MTSRNFLKAGDFAEPIPLGIQITLQYQPSGTFQLLHFDFNDDAYSDNKKLESQCRDILIQNKLIPKSVLTQGGTVKVRGVLVVDNVLLTCGEMPQAQYSRLMEVSKFKNCNLKFYALDADCTNIILANGVYTRNWLKFQGFSLIPGLNVPITDYHPLLDQVIADSDIRYLPIVGNYRFRKADKSYINFHYHIVKIKSIEPYLDESGYLHTKLDCIYSELGDHISIKTSYYESIVKFNLKAEDYIIIDNHNSIVQKYHTVNLKQNSNEYTCQFCGRKYEIEDDFTQCKNKHCMSHMYDNINRFIRLFIDGQYFMSYEVYVELVQNDELTGLQDLLTIHPYDLAEYTKSMYEVLDACISDDDLRNREVIWDFCAACNHSQTTIYHYLDNPHEIFADLNIYSRELVNWLDDIQNIVTIKSICNLSNVHIVESVKKFDGAPIFRDKKISLTGKFIHGSISDVSSILMSYSASISDVESSDCLIIGDIQEDINGHYIHYAQNHKIPIMNESDFFSLYEIDKDLDELNKKSE